MTLFQGTYLKLLADLNIAIIEEFKVILELNVILLKLFSEYKFQFREKKLVKIIEQLVVKIIYLLPLKDYLNTEDALNTFENSSINIEYFSFNHPTYNQIGNNLLVI